MSTLLDRGFGGDLLSPATEQLSGLGVDYRHVAAYAPEGPADRCNPVSEDVLLMRSSSSGQEMTRIPLPPVFTHRTAAAHARGLDGGVRLVVPPRCAGHGRSCVRDDHRDDDPRRVSSLNHVEQAGRSSRWGAFPRVSTMAPGDKCRIVAIRRRIQVSVFVVGVYDLLCRLGCLSPIPCLSKGSVLVVREAPFREKMSS